MSAASTMPERRERKKEEVRRTILRSAEKLFRRDGYTATSMTDIALDSGISRKTLFNYMESKESIVLALVDAFIGANMPGWLEPDEPSHHDARDIVGPNIKQRLDKIARHRWILTIAAEHTRFFASDKTKFVSDALEANLRARERRIAKVQAEGRIRADIPAIEISRYYEVLRDHAIRNWLLLPRSTSKDLHRLFDNVMAVLQRGLEPTGSEKGK